MLIVFGLDGATFDLMQPWLEAGALPNLQALAARGVRGRLASTLPPLTAPAWTSFMTGKSPPGHGVFDFFRLGPAGIEFVDHGGIHAPAFWDYLSEAGKKSAILNLPLTYPPPSLEGILIPGLLSPMDSPEAFPPGLLESLEQELGPLRPVPDTLYWPGNEDAFVAALQAFTDQQIRFARKIIGDHSPDITVVHFLATDIAQHKLWKHLDPAHPWHHPTKSPRVKQKVLRLFQQLDSAIAELIELAGPDANVVVMSDHGFGPLEKIVNLNRLLQDHGLLELRRGVGVSLRHWAAKRPVLAALARRALRLAGRQELLPLSDIDWTKTEAFSLGHCGQIFINLAGRQPHGSVPEAGYGETRARVVEALADLPMPVEVYYPDENASVPNAGTGPDLFVVMDGYKAAAHPLLAGDGKIVAEIRHGDSGFHRPDGIFIGSGPAFHKARRISGARIIDMAPTMLYLAGERIPMDMDGAVLQQAISPTFSAENPIQFREPVTKRRSGTVASADSAELDRHLRALGYLQ